MDHGDRSFAGSSDKQPLSPLAKADRAIKTSLAMNGIDALRIWGHDKGGDFITVAVKPADIHRAREWQEAYGRSHGCVRIFVREMT